MDDVNQNEEEQKLYSDDTSELTLLQKLHLIVLALLLLAVGFSGGHIHSLLAKETKDEAPIAHIPDTNDKLPVVTLSSVTSAGIKGTVANKPVRIVYGSYVTEWKADQEYTLPITLSCPVNPTSSSTSSTTSQGTAKTSSAPTASGYAPPANCPFVASKNSTVVHTTTESWLKRIKQENQVCFMTLEEAIAKGLTPEK